MATKQSGQTLPLVALMMVCIMGVAALAVDGSNAYSQQRRMQADLDMAVKIAAAEGSTGDAYTQLHQRGYVDVNSDGTRGITINLSPNLSPSAGPYAKYPSG